MEWYALHTRWYLLKSSNYCWFDDEHHFGQKLMSLDQYENNKSGTIVGQGETVSEKKLEKICSSATAGPLQWSMGTWNYENPKTFTPQNFELKIWIIPHFWKEKPANCATNKKSNLSNSLFRLILGGTNRFSWGWVKWLVNIHVDTPCSWHCSRLHHPLPLSLHQY